MPRILREINSSKEISTGLRAIHFLGTISTDMIVILIYDRPLAEAVWLPAAKQLGDAVGVRNVSGRCKGAVLRVGANHVIERFALRDGQQLQYVQVESSFSNPNGYMNQETLTWLCEVSRGIVAQAASADVQLLELYCGNGNHTMALARSAAPPDAPLTALRCCVTPTDQPTHRRTVCHTHTARAACAARCRYYQQVVAIEIDEELCRAGERNIEMNGITNARIVHCPSEKYCHRVMQRSAGGGSPHGGGVSQKPQRHAEQQQAFGIYSNTSDAAGAGAGAGTGAGAAPEQQVRVPEPGQCSVVLVDPPRAGLDEVTRKLVGSFSHILYISCEPLVALHRDLGALHATHEVARFVVLDHFPYTGHVECAVHMRRRS
jgi:tRNA (uracil-5-)-methyltransferase